jgi:hypothetical protein
MRRILTLAVAVAVAAAGSGCGGDDDGKKEGATPPSSSAPAPAPARGEKQEAKKHSGQASPEDQPGGAGDEVPARAPALVTGRGGRIRPRVVRVPPFIAVRVELRSADGRPYALRFGSKVLRVGPQVATMSTTLRGLHHGEAITGRPVAGGGNPVRIEASAEPGP